MFDRKKWEQEYQSRPEVKERRKEYGKKYYSRPEIKEKRKEWYELYMSRPEVKARKKEYYSSPEFKEKQRKYHQKYYSRPEVKERLKEYDRCRWREGRRSRGNSCLIEKIRLLESIPEKERSLIQCERLKGYQTLKILDRPVEPDFFTMLREKKVCPGGS